MKGTNSATAVQPARPSEHAAIHEWRVSRLTLLGLPRPDADAVADRVDWHEVACLVEQGCPAELAVRIVR